MTDTDAGTGSAWKRPLQGWLAWLVWAVAVVGVSALAWVVIGLLSLDPFGPAMSWRWLIALGIGFGVAVLLRGMAWCLSSWPNFKHALLAGGCVAGFVLLFYAEEDLRGWLAWRLFTSRAEAKGEKFNFRQGFPMSRTLRWLGWSHPPMARCLIGMAT